MTLSHREHLSFPPTVLTSLGTQTPCPRRPRELGGFQHIVWKMAHCHFTPFKLARLEKPPGSREQKLWGPRETERCGLP